MGDKAFRLMRRREMRRGLGLPAVAAETPYAELLAINEDTRRFPGLRGVAMGDLRAEVTRLAEPDRSPVVRHPLAPHFLGKGINPVVFDWARRGPVDLYRYENISMVAEGGMAVFFRGKVVDEQSTGIARGVAELDGLPAIHISRAAYIDDIYKAANPCHFMADRLPRVYHYTRLAGLPEGECVTVNATSPYPIYALERVAPSARVLEPLKLYHFDELFLLNTCARPIGHPFFFLEEGVLDFILPAMAAGLALPEQRRRLYLSRFASDRRRLVNEENLAQMLAQRGFEILEMSELTPQEQLNAIRQSELVVAPHGAALASMVAATPRNRVLELINPKRGTAAYGAMAAAAGTPYTPLFGTPVDKSGLDDPWRIDLEAVARALDGPPAWAGGRAA